MKQWFAFIKELNLLMELQYKEKKVTQNPLLNQFKIIKQKLMQRGSSIIQLTKQLRVQRKSMLQTISEFQAHERRITNRLKRLEQINIRYIKQYAQIKKIGPNEEMQMQMSDNLYDASSREVLLKKIEYFKQYYTQSLQNTSNKGAPAFNQTVTNVCQFLKSYLLERQIDYQKALQAIAEQKRKRLKEAKGLESFKANKQQQKVIESLKNKISKFKSVLPSLHQNNLIQIFSLRKQIQNQITKLDPCRYQSALEQSSQEQTMLSKLIEEIVMLSTEDCVADRISDVFLASHLKFVEDATLKLSEEYGEDFVARSIGKIQTLSAQMKEGVMKGLSQRELTEIVRRQRRSFQLKGQANSESLDDAYGIQDIQGYRSGYSQSKNSYNYQKYTQFRRDADQLEQDNLDLTQVQLIAEASTKFTAKNKNHPSAGLNQDQQNQSKQQNAEMEGSFFEKGTQKHKRPAKQSKLNATFQATMTKSFFQQQQKSRDTLIANQKSELVEHSKVIDKLITFIKKEFKDKMLQQIDADDPEKLMSYYFKVNEKKYVDITEELKQVSTKKKIIQNEKNCIIEELKEQKEQILNEKKELQVTKTNLQLKNRQLVQQKKVAEVSLASQKQKAAQLQSHCQNLKLKLQLQKFQIIALSQIYQKLKTNTLKFQNVTQGFQNVTQGTENIIKLSLQTLFNLCLNKLNPQQIIQRLESIIQIIKVNVKLKCDVNYDISISELIEKEEQTAKNNFTAKLTQSLIPFKDSASHTLNNNFTNQYLVLHHQNPSMELDEKQQAPKIFLHYLRQIAKKIIEQQVVKNQISPEQKEREDKIVQQAKAQQDLQQNHQNNKIRQIFPDLLSGFVSIMTGNLEQKEEKSQNAGIDQTFIDRMMENLKKVKQNKTNNDQEDINEMYEKYKQAVACLQRSQQLNKDYEMKYQAFLNDFKKKGAYEAPQSLEEKLFYMERVITQQNELLQNQRRQYEDTILKQVEKSEELAQSVLKSIKQSRKKTNLQKATTQI